MSIKEDTPFYEIYYLENCFYSQKALNYLKNYGIPYKIINVKQIDKQKYKDFLKKETFPQIYYNGSDNKCYEIGGCSDLEKLIKNMINR
tara:strand:- start:122 stop:388 length:267 start_codon:yes stop_codon:yes gene_type:complete